MSMVVRNNIAAQMALGELNKNVNKAGVLLGKIASGQKITGAKDDAANFAISEKMREQIRSLVQDNQNVQNGSSMLRTAAGGVDNIVDELRNLKELAINAANDHNTSQDRLTIQKDFQQKMANINDIATMTNYNGKTLLDGRYKISAEENLQKELHHIERQLVLTGVDEREITLTSPSVTKIHNSDGTVTIKQNNNLSGLLKNFTAVGGSARSVTNPTYVTASGTRASADFGFSGTNTWSWADNYSRNFNYATQPSQVIKDFMTSLDSTTLLGTAALDQAINSASNGKFATLQDLTGSFMADLQSSGYGENFLINYCDIYLTNSDTGAISGWDARGNNVKTAQSVVPESSSPSSWVMPDVTQNSVFNGLTVEWPSYGANGASYTDTKTGTAFTESEEHILKGLNSEWITDSLQLVSDSFGIDFNTSGAQPTSIKVNLTKIASNPNALAAVAHADSDGDGKTDSLELIVNMDYYEKINKNSADGAIVSSSTNYLDRTLAHEFTHAVMSANIDNFDKLPLYIVEGTAEVVHGIDDERKRTITNLASSSGVNRLNTLFSTGGSQTTDPEDSYAGGYMLLRYLAKQSAGADKIFSTDRIYKSDTAMDKAQTAVAVTFDFANITDLNGNSINLPGGLNGQGFSCVCGGCQQFINFKFDASKTATDSEFKKYDASRSEYIIGVQDVKNGDDLSEAIFQGINAIHINQNTTTGDIYEMDNTQDPPVKGDPVNIAVHDRHDVRMAINPEYDGTNPKYVFLKMTSPEMNFIASGMILGTEQAGETDDLPEGTWNGNEETIIITDTKTIKIKDLHYEEQEVDVVTYENERRRALGNPLKIHHGTEANQATNFFINDMHTKSLGTSNLLDKDGNIINEADEDRYWALSYDKTKQAAWLDTLKAAQNKTIDDIDVKTKQNANVAIRVLDGAIDYALDESTRLGAYLQRLEYTDSNIATMNENVQASESTIRDADMAKEMTDYTKANVLVQSAQAMLAQANQNSSSVLSLLQ